MEKIEYISALKDATWFEKRCRDIVHSVFSKLSYGQLEIVEATHHEFFPQHIPSNTQSTADITLIQGKIYIHDISVYRDFVKGGSIGAAEAFIDGK